MPIWSACASTAEEAEAGDGHLSVCRVRQVPECIWTVSPILDQSMEIKLWVHCLKEEPRRPLPPTVLQGRVMSCAIPLTVEFTLRGGSWLMNWQPWPPWPRMDALLLGPVGKPCSIHSLVVWLHHLNQNISQSILSRSNRLLMAIRVSIRQLLMS